MVTAIADPRMDREKRTIGTMVRLYCKGHHGGAIDPCPDCAELLEYAQLRLEKCPFQEKKPTCAKCTVHCYRSEMKERIRAVMRYSGPRMLVHHPLLALRHSLDGKKNGR